MQASFPFFDGCEPTYRLSTRVHEMFDFCHTGEWFVKRDDELSFSISGSKFRKYASLIYKLKKQGIKKVILEGGQNSNHLIGCLQLLIENQIDYELILLQSSSALQGNALWLSFLKENKRVLELTRSEWTQRDLHYNRTFLNDEIFLPEGADHPFALAGAMTLGHDIALNQRELGIHFDHIFIDSGTGFSAIGLLYALASENLSPHVHIIQMAPLSSTFSDKLDYYSLYLPIQPLKIPPYSLYESAIAPSFGSTNSEIFRFIKKLFCKQGFICDPVYSAKLFFSAQKIAEEKKLQGKCLCIHSGGGFSLMGFEKHLSKL